MKKRDEDKDMDVVVAQQAIGDPSPPGDGDVLMGRCLPAYYLGQRPSFLMKLPLEVDLLWPASFASGFHFPPSLCSGIQTSLGNPLLSKVGINRPEGRIQFHVELG